MAEQASRLETALGGPTRARVILVLAAVLSLQSADLGTVGAVAPELKRALGISNTQIGLLATVVLVTGAIATIPFGMLTDRVNRPRLLSAAVALWAAAMVASAVAPTFGFLLLTRVGLGFAHRRLLRCVGTRTRVRLGRGR
jgi:predicted MFS family arabinose efflux permease